MTNRYTIGHPEEWWNPADWVDEDEDDGARTDMLIKQAKEERYFDDIG